MRTEGLKSKRDRLRWRMDSMTQEEEPEERHEGRKTEVAQEDREKEKENQVVITMDKNTSYAPASL